MTKDILVTIIRQLITAALSVWFAKLSKYGVDTGQILLLISIVIVFVVNVAWAVGERLLKKWNLLAALQLPQQATAEQLTAIVSQVSPITKISQVIGADTEEAVRTTLEKTPAAKNV